MKKYYEILGLPENASKSQIKKAYFKLAKIWHPDVNKSPHAEDKFVEIKLAYEILIDPTQRVKKVYRKANPVYTKYKQEQKQKQDEQRARNKARSAARMRKAALDEEELEEGLVRAKKMLSVSGTILFGLIVLAVKTEFIFFFVMLAFLGIPLGLFFLGSVVEFNRINKKIKK